MAAGHPGDLNVRDPGEIGGDGGGEVVAHDLHVIEVVFEIEIIAADGFDDGERLGRGVQEITRHVAGIDRLDQQFHAQRSASPGGGFQILDIGLFHLAAPGLVGDDAGHGVKARARKRLGVIERRADAVPELALAARQRRQAPLSGLALPRRHVEEDLVEAVSRQPIGQRARRPIIARRVLDAGESGLGGALEAVQERRFGEQHAEIGGELGHYSLTAPAPRPYSPAPPAASPAMGPGTELSAMEASSASKS